MENFIIANKTDVGLSRQVNEDSLITFDSPNGRIVTVCDGMGGQAAGDVASQLACSIIRDILENNTFATPEEAITKSMVAANQGILHRVSQEPQLEGMGATCVMLIVKDGQVYCGWVGDSRIYYICNHTIRQISKDQSYVQSLVDSGVLTPEQAEHHPQKNEITNALGVPGMTPPVLTQIPITPSPGSVFLLCSDGLTGMVDNDHIERIVSKSNLSLQERADLLVATANQNGGLDNITVQLVEFPAVASSNVVRASRKKMKSKWVMATIMACLVLCLLALAGYFIFFDKPAPKKAEKPQGTETVIDARKPKEEPSEKVAPKEEEAPVVTETTKDVAKEKKEVKATPRDVRQQRGGANRNRNTERILETVSSADSKSADNKIQEESKDNNSKNGNGQKTDALELKQSER